MSTSKIVKEAFPLGRSPFRTFDPFLFCAYHNDTYPAGTAQMAPPPASLRGRNIGSDFSYKDGWSMYHGETLPGFPEHPHRGFETISITRQGLVDHSDSIKCTARYGNGDTQWMTAGKGIQHAEMLPLLNQNGPNPVQAFQVWLNLPSKQKMCDPHFTMFWEEETPYLRMKSTTGAGGDAVVKVVAGELQGVQPLPPPPNSWAARSDTDVAVWEVVLPAGSTITLPAARGGASSSRAIYFVEGDQLRVANEATVPRMTGVRLAAEQPLALTATGAEARVLLLQGRPIQEPVVQHGPFVMNTAEEIRQCFDDFRRTQFGGWPWAESDHAHSRDTPRHALHPDGRKEFPPNKKPSSQ